MDIRKSQLVKVETFVLLGRGGFATPTCGHIPTGTDDLEEVEPHATSSNETIAAV